MLAITNSPRIQMDLRVLAIQERWHMIFAQDLATGLLLARLQKTVVVMYDDETADADWHAASRGFSDYGIPVFFVLLATVPDRRLWRSVLDRGGFDVAHRRVERRKLAPIINSAFDLAEDINSKLRTGSKLVPMP